MLGQMIVASFHGPIPSPTLLSRIRRGQIGGVILFADNVAGGVEATRRLTSRLQRAAARGRNPPLLIMTDQEGGEVRRLVGPPYLAPAAMQSGNVARLQGQAAGRLLRSAGIDLDLAPVADVEGIPDSFLGTRAFGSSPTTVAQRACAFAQGLASQGVAYTLKHFPGLGLATGNTDLGPVSVTASAQTLREDYRAYQACGGRSLAMVMVSSASYPSLSGPLPAVMSPEIYARELRLAVPGGSPVTISDDLESPAIESQSSPARHAIQAGLDMLMYAQTEQASAAAYAKLLAEVRSGEIPRPRLVAADGKIRSLKARLDRDG
jgi:beta-N-acetylhexosaminidase